MPTPAEWNDPEYRERLNRYANPVVTFEETRCAHSWVNKALIGTGYYCADCGEDCEGPSWMEELGFDGGL